MHPKFTLTLFGIVLIMGIGVSNKAQANPTGLAAPTTQASQIVVSNLTATSATLSWTNGNGENRVVFVENPSGTARAPYNNTTYSASADWSTKGTQLPNSNYYCVYNGSGNSVTLTNLTPNSTFAVRISEYNGAGGNELYLTSIDAVQNNPISFTTPAVTKPTLQASQIVVSNLTATSATLSWTNGNGAKRTVFVENPSGTAAAPYDNNSYAASTDWGAKGTRIGSSNYYCVYNGSGNSVTLTNLTPNSTFAVRISEYNGAVGSELYLTSIDAVQNNPISFTTPAVAKPTLQASHIVVSNLTATSATLSWTNGNGAKRTVFVENPSGTAAAPYDNNSYAASADWGAKGTRIGSSNYYCVYNGSGNSVSLTNLTPSSKFSVRISEYNGSASGEQYLTDIASLVDNPCVFNTPALPTKLNQPEGDDATVSVSPNPTTGWIKISAPSNGGQSMAISIRNLCGKVVYEATSLPFSVDVDLSNHAPGIYIVKVEANGVTTVHKVIKR